MLLIAQMRTRPIIRLLLIIKGNLLNCAITTLTRVRMFMSNFNKKAVEIKDNSTNQAFYDIDLSNFIIILRKVSRTTLMYLRFNIELVQYQGRFII